MLGIIVCDDDKFMMEMSMKLVQECIVKNKFDAEIACFTTNFNEVLQYFKKNKGTYLYFLDLDFGKEAFNGIDIAKTIKKAEPLSKIVFVTSHGDMGMEILKSGVEAFGFIEKSLVAGKMLMEYKKYILLALGQNLVTKDKLQTNEKTIQLPVGIDEYIEVPIQNILYVESTKTISHFVCYHTVDGSQISVRDTIENVLQVLGSDFMKSHRSVIINKNYVIAVADGLVKFSNGDTVACSFRLKSDIIKKCLQ